MDDFGPGTGLPALWEIEADVIDTEGYQLEPGEEMHASWVTISRTEAHAIERTKECFAGMGFEVQSDFTTERFEIETPADVFQHINSLQNDPDTESTQWVKHQHDTHLGP